MVCLLFENSSKINFLLSLPVFESNSSICIQFHISRSSSSSSSSSTNLSQSESRIGKLSFSRFRSRKIRSYFTHDSVWSRPISSLPISTRANHSPVFGWHLHPRSLTLRTFSCMNSQTSSWLFIYWLFHDLESTLILFSTFLSISTKK